MMVVERIVQTRTTRSSKQKERQQTGKNGARNSSFDITVEYFHNVTCIYRTYKVIRFLPFTFYQKKRNVFIYI